MSKESYEHKLYKHCEEKDADAVAWAFVNKEKMVKFPFKFPTLLPNELRANILYAGLCHSDVLTVREQWGPAMFPLAPGHEIVAEVSQVGKDVKDYKKGDLVGFGTMRDCCHKCKYCKAGDEELCTGCEEPFTYGFHWGGYATAIQQPAEFFFHLPKEFDISKGAPLFCAGATTYRPMSLYLKPGMNTAVLGFGGLGHLAVQFLKKLGHEVSVFTTTNSKEALIKKLGGDHIILSNDNKQMDDAKGKFDFIINTIPTAKGFDKYFACVAKGGYFVQVGQPALDDSSIGCTCWDLVVKEVKLVGSCVAPRHTIKDMVKICVDKKVYPMVEEFAFDDFPKAFDKLEKGKPQFRCVVNCGEYAKKHGLFK